MRCAAERALPGAAVRGSLRGRNTGTGNFVVRHSSVTQARVYKTMSRAYTR